MLAGARVGHLATCDEHGAPHVVAVCFSLYQGNLYSVLDRKPKRTALKRLKRVRNILANPKRTGVDFGTSWSLGLRRCWKRAKSGLKP